MHGLIDSLFFFIFTIILIFSMVAKIVWEPSENRGVSFDSWLHNYYHGPSLTFLGLFIASNWWINSSAVRFSALLITFTFFSQYYILAQMKYNSEHTFKWLEMVEWFYLFDLSLFSFNLNICLSFWMQLRWGLYSLRTRSQREALRASYTRNQWDIEMTTLYLF